MCTEPDRDNADEVWELLSDRVEALVAAWEGQEQPPRLEEFLPDETAAVRRMVLTELIKVDLEYGWRERRRPRLLEAYLDEFPELAAGGIPGDLIYEEYHVRRQSGDDPAREEYFERFPKQAAEIAPLLGLEAPDLTTTLSTSERLQQVQVGQRLDDFDLLSELGRGAFAKVFLARQRSMQRSVALKVSANKGSEPQTLAQLDHPNIVRVYDNRVLPDRKLRLLYMQYVPGGTLHDVMADVRAIPVHERRGSDLLRSVDRALERRGESPPRDSALRRRLKSASWPEAVCWIGARLAAALHYAHGRGVLHRDVKPANVLLTGDGRPKLADFNISFSSKVAGATPAAYFGGSLAYMSPEQLEACNPAHARRAEDLDGRSDLYSLGVMLWELLTGTRPLADNSLDEGWSAALAAMAAERRAGVDPKRLAELPAGTPPGFGPALLKCLAPHADDRFASAEAAQRQFELCLLPEVQKLLHPPARGWVRWVRRRPLLALTLVGIASNAAVSVINILYNLNDIIDEYLEGDRDVFLGQLVTVNGVLYSLGFAWSVALVWSVIRGVGQVNAGAIIDPAGLSVLRSRTLRAGPYIASVSFVLWVASGIVFPLGLPKMLAVPGAFSRFVLSQVLCGAMAATLAFFLASLLAIRAIYPVLVDVETFGTADIERLRRMRAWLWAAFVVAILTPLAASLTLSASGSTLRTAFAAIGVVGLVNLALSLGLLPVLQRAISWLTAIAEPGAATESERGPAD
ncbi:MAG: protein kinase [Planctomycetes bacterium]|nr:protein kinase [Planctomycetota bacterium]